MARDIFPSILSRLSRDEPVLGDVRLASVSVMLREPERPSTLLIKRAERSSDPWSGQIAFPGGKMQKGDARVRDIAARETREEVGIDLEASAEFLGYSGPTRTHTGSMDVVPSVYLLKSPVRVKPNGEVSSHRWVSLQRLTAPAARSSYKLSYQGRTVHMPAFTVGSYVVWGLTYRIVSSLLGSPGNSA